MKALKALEKEQKDNFAGHMLVEKENRQLRKRINSIRRMVDMQLGKEIRIQNCMIDVIERERVAQKK